MEAKSKMNVVCHSAKMECFVRPEDVERFLTECPVKHVRPYSRIAAVLR